MHWSTEEDTLALDIRRASDTVVRTAANAGAVIVGWGSEFHLAGDPGVVRVRVDADVDRRVERLSSSEHLEVRAARRRVRRDDRARRDSVRLHYDCDLRDARHYDLVVDTSGVALDAAVRSIVEFVSVRRDG
jgi:cytidylate kinase